MKCSGLSELYAHSVSVLSIQYYLQNTGVFGCKYFPYTVASVPVKCYFSNLVNLEQNPPRSYSVLGATFLHRLYARINCIDCLVDSVGAHRERCAWEMRFRTRAMRAVRARDASNVLMHFKQTCIARTTVASEMTVNQPEMLGNFGKRGSYRHGLKEAVHLQQ